MQRYLISPDQVQGEQFVIRGDDVHHIRRVMRFRPGDQLIACDGEGTDYLGELTEEIGNEVICRILRREPSAGEPGLQVTLAQSLPKGDKWEWVLQKGTELGASSFLPFTSRRTVVKWDRVKAEKRRSPLEADPQGGGRAIPPRAHSYGFPGDRLERVARGDREGGVGAHRLRGRR